MLIVIVLYVLIPSDGDTAEGENEDDASIAFCSTVLYNNDLNHSNLFLIHYVIF